MATGFWTSLVHRVAARQTQAHLAEDVSEAVGHPDLRLAGDLQRLDQLVTVRPGTLVVVLAAGLPPRLQVPGDHLRPRLRSARNPTQLLVLNTAPVVLEVTIDQLLTLDGVAIDNTVISVTVQLADDDDHRALLDLASEFAADLEAELLRRLHREVLTGAQAAVAMNRFDDVRRLTLTALAGRWLPRTFADGTLVRRDLIVLEPDPDAPDASPSAAPSVGDASDEEFELNLDPELARLWREHAESELHGISGARVLDDCTVVAVPATHPGADQSSRLQEAYGGYFNHLDVHVISAPAGSYAGLVQSWFTQVDGSPGRLVSVMATPDRTLRIAVDQALAPQQEIERALTVGNPADRKALRRLVPHEQVAFVDAGPTS